MSLERKQHTFIFNFVLTLWGGIMETEKLELKYLGDDRCVDSRRVDRTVKRDENAQRTRIISRVLAEI